MKIPKKTKKKIFIGIIIGLMIFSLLTFLSDNAFGLQNDNDIEATLHCTLKTDSLELTGSNLMTTGTHTFYETPELDIGSYSYDSTRIDVTNLQYPSYNQTGPSLNHEISVIGNQTINTTCEISSYTVSAPKDTFFTVKINFTTNRTHLYNPSVLDLYAADSAPRDIFWNGVNWFVCDSDDKKIYQYSSVWVYTGTSYDLSGQCNSPYSIFWDGTNWFVLDYNMRKVFKYSSVWVYTGTSYDISGQVFCPRDIFYDGSNWFVCDDNKRKVFKYSSVWVYTGTSYDISSEDTICFDIFWDGYYWFMQGLEHDKLYQYDKDWVYMDEVIAFDGTSELLSCYALDNKLYVLDSLTNDDIITYDYRNPFNASYINLNYTILGTDYQDIIELTCSSTDIEAHNGTLIYEGDSSLLANYDHINDLVVKTQNTTLIIDSGYSDQNVSFSVDYINYSTCEWRVPTEVSLTINSEEVIDNTFNSGFVILDIFPLSLIITATDSVYFRLNITVDFSFTFNFEIISKTYLRKRFELESNHFIYIEQMVFDSDLNIKKIYLNNIDRGSLNPCPLSPPVSMNTGNIYILEIILTEELYLPLQYLYNNLGSGTSNIYLSGISNTLTYSNINGNHLYSIVLPTDWHVEYAQLSFSDLEYLPDYIPNYADDLSGYGYGYSSYGNEEVSWLDRYYQTNQNGSFLEDSGGSGYENVYSEYFNALNSHMTQNNGSLNGHNNTYTVADYLFMQNLFPQELKYEDWLSWVHTYNSEYISSSFDTTGVNLTSVLNTGSELTVPEFTDFSFTNGTHLSDGDLYTIDGDYSTEHAETSLNYTGSVFSVAGEDTSPVSIVKRNEYYYMLGASHKRVYRYYENFTYEGTSYDISGEIMTPYGMGYDGSYFWIADNTGDMILRFNSNFVYTGTGTYVGNQATNPVGILKLGSYYYLSDRGKGMVYKYTSTWSYTGTSYDVSGQDATPRGLYYDGTYIYICGDATDKIYKYTTAWSYTGTSFDVSNEDTSIWQSFKNSTNWCLLGNGNDAIFMYEEDLITELNFTSQIINIIDGIYSNDTIESYTLFYSYKTDESIEISFSIWNYDTSSWDLINQSINTDNFFNFNFTLNSSYYDGSYNVILKFEGHGIVEFELYIDKLVVQVNWTKTSGEIYSTIEKDIDFSFLNLYDSISSEYQLLYNITLEFCYRYSNYTKYSEFAQFEYYENSYTLIKDEIWHTISFNFEFDSLNVPSFTLLFNITNGLLELNSILNYSIFFKCLLNTSYYDNFPDNLNWESVGETNPAWVNIKNLLGAEVIIVDEWQDHKNVLRLSNLVGQSPYVAHGLDVASTSGTMELYIGSSDVSKNQQWVFAGAVNYHIFLRIKDSKLYRLTPAWTEVEIQSVVSNTWYHIKVEWRADNTYDVYVDTIKKVDNATMVQNQVAGVAGLIVQTQGDSGTYYSYTDAPSEVSHPNYNEGDNLRMREVTELYSKFKYTPNLNLDSLQENNGNFILNFTYDFDPSLDAGLYNFFNSVNHSLLHFNLSIEHEDGWTSVVYNYNTTQSNVDFTLNITSVLDGLGKDKFLNFYLEFYLSGNPSNFTLDNLTLFDYDSYFYEVSALWISDTLVVSHQNVSVYWIASDRYIRNIEIHQEFDNNIYLLYNGTLLNNTLQSFEFWNASAGFYELNLTFYDNYSNWERWTCNFTIWDRISISTAYKNPCLINQDNTIYVHIDTEYSIIDIFYDNSTNYIHEYANSSYPIYQYEFNFTLSYNVETVYNISILVVGEYNDSFWCNITNLSFIQRTTFLDFNNLYYSYYQDEQMNLTFVLRDLYSNPVSNKLLNYTIEDPHGNHIVNGSGITNSYGNITYNLPFNILYDIGFYHLNVSFNGTKDYIANWKLQSFQLRPIIRVVNSTDFNLTVNNFPVINNFIQINWTNNFTIANNNTALFDMTISLKLNYTEAISYNGHLSYSNTFITTTDILYLTFDNATLFNYPSNFTDYYFDNVKSSHYVTSGSRFTISDIIGKKFYDNNHFSILFTYMDTSQIERVQLTKTPRTDSDIVQFKEYLTANRAFSYWYFHNSLNITTVSLYHNRTGATIAYTDFTIENSNYYFEKSCISGDLFTATTSYWIDWDNYIDYQILTNNGTYCEIKITYQAPIYVNNVTIILNLRPDGLYAENWDHNAIQSDLTYILELPHINFTTTQQTIILKGISTIPVISFRYLINADGFKLSDEEWKIKVTDEKWRTIKRANWEDLNEYIIGYLEIPKYSEAFRVSIESDWELDGIHYGNQYYNIESNGYFECDGFGAGITAAYLKFKTNPLSNLKREAISGKVVYKINAKYRLDNIDFIFYIEESESYNKQDMIKELGKKVDCDKIIEYYTVKDRTYFLILNLDLHEGINEIVINYKIERMADYAWLFLIIAIVLIGFSTIYITLRYKDNRIKDFIKLDKIVKLFVWIKKSKRDKLLKRNRYKPKKKIKKR